MHKWASVQVTGERPQPRYAHTATLLKFSRFLVFGGTDGTNLFNDVHIFQVETASWHKKECRGQLPSPRCLHSAFRHRKRLFVIGGKCVAPGASAASAWLNDAYVLDLKTFIWSKFEYASTAPRGTEMQISLQMRDTKIMFFGGSKMREGSKKLAPMNAAHVLDLTNKTWESARLFGDNPPMRSYPSVTLIKHEVWMFGGYNGLKRFNDTYNLALRGNIWRAIKSNAMSAGAASGSASRDTAQPSTRYHHFAVSLDHYLFIIAGFSSKWLCDVHVLNTVTQKWRSIAMSPHVSDSETESVPALPREAFTGTLVGHELYLFGGSIRGKSFNDMHVLNLGECVGKWGSANPLQGLRLQRQRQLAQRTRDESSADKTNENPFTAKLATPTATLEVDGTADRSTTVTIHETDRRLWPRVLKRDQQPQKTLRGRRHTTGPDLEGRDKSKSPLQTEGKALGDSKIVTMTGTEPRWNANHETASDQHSHGVPSGLGSIPEPIPETMEPTSTRRRERRAAKSLSKSLDDRFVDNLISPTRLLRSDLRETLHLDVHGLGPNGAAQRAQPQTISLGQLGQKMWEYSNGAGSTLTESGSNDNHTDAANEALADTIAVLGSAVAAGQNAVQEAKEKVEELQEALGQMRVTLEQSRIKKRMGMERIQRLRDKFKTLQQKAKEKTILREKAVQQAQNFSKSIGRLSDKIAKRDIDIREQERQSSLIMEEIRRLQEQDRQTIVRKARLQAEAQALRKSVAVLEDHLVQKRQERQQSEVQSKFLRQRITELTEQYDRQRRRRASRRSKRKQSRHRSPISFSRDHVHLTTTASSEEISAHAITVKASREGSPSLLAVGDPSAHSRGDNGDLPSVGDARASEDQVATSPPPPSLVDCSSDSEIVNTGKLILTRALSDDGDGKA